jgi:hypothetical protein
MLLGGSLFWIDSAVTHYRERLSLPITFKPSPSFTDRRRARIRHDLIVFREYLKQIEFPLQDRVPPIAISTFYVDRPIGHLPSVKTDPGPEFFKNTLTLRPEDIDDSHAIVALYALYEVMKAVNFKASPLRSYVGMLMADYALSSFDNKPEGLIAKDNFLKTFWDVRVSCGKEFADHLWVYFMRSFQSDVKDEATFEKQSVEAIDRDFDTHLSWSLNIVDDGTHRAEVSKIEKANGINAKHSSQ